MIRAPSSIGPDLERIFSGQFQEHGDLAQDLGYIFIIHII